MAHIEKFRIWGSPARYCKPCRVKWNRAWNMKAKMVVSPNWGYLSRGPRNKDYIIFGSIFGFLYFGKLPNGLVQRFIGIVA